MLKYFLLFVLVAIITFIIYIVSFGYWRIGDKAMHELALPKVYLNEKSKTWELGLGVPGYMSRFEHPNGTMYLLKSLSGTLPITITAQKDKVIVQAQSVRNLKLDHEGATIRKIYYSLTPLSSVIISTPDGKECSAPRFLLSMELYLVDNVVRPVKLLYEWEFQYDPEKKAFIPNFDTNANCSTVTSNIVSRTLRVSCDCMKEEAETIVQPSWD